MCKTDLCSLELVRYRGLAFHGVLASSPFPTSAVGSPPVPRPPIATSLPQAPEPSEPGPCSVTSDGQQKTKYVQEEITP